MKVPLFVLTIMILGFKVTKAQEVASSESYRINPLDDSKYGKQYLPNYLAVSETSRKKDKDSTYKSPWAYTYSLDLNLSNFFEVNSSTGPDKKNFSLASAIDLGLNYSKDSGFFQMTNEFHWLFEIQKTDLKDSSHMKKIVDNIRTLHDFSISASRKKKWNLNLIAKVSTPIFTIYNGEYFKNYNNKGRIKGFFNPYEVILSPGIKYQPTPYFRVSLSPYSMSLFGFRSQQIANTGLYSENADSGTNYKLFLFKQLGAEANVWYDRNIKERIYFQYRLGISTDYFKNIGRNGLMDGLFITKVMLFKNIYLAHRATLTSNFASKPFKPYYGQIIMLGFTKSL